MKLLSGILIAGGVIACFIAFGSYHRHKVNTVLADEPLTSEFFRTYDPGPLFSKYGTVRQNLGSMGGTEATQTRAITATIVMPANKVASLTAELRNDVESRLQAQGRRMSLGEDSGEYSYEYESGTTWGYFIVERIEPEQPTGGDATTWRVRMRFIERPRK